MRYLIALMVLCFTAVPALAQDISIQALCNQLPLHKPTDANYKPGVDAQGNPVAPADLGAPVEHPIVYPMQIPVSIDLIKFLNTDLPGNIENVTEIKPDAAYLTLYEDGHIEYNGQDISDRATYVCAEGKLPEVSTPAAGAAAEPGPVPAPAAAVAPAPAPEKLGPVAAPVTPTEKTP